MSDKTKNVIVAGSPGAFVGVVSKHLNQRGWAIKWPGQCLDITHARRHFTEHGQNFEVHRVQQEICEQLNCELYSLNFPALYSPPYPGPAEIAAKFDGPAIFAAPSLPPFMDIWQVAADAVIDIQCSEAADIAALADWTRNRYAASYLRELRKAFIARYHSHLPLFSRQFTITNAEIAERRFSSLNEFLAAVLVGA